MPEDKDLPLWSLRLLVAAGFVSVANSIVQYTDPSPGWQTASGALLGATLMLFLMAFAIPLLPAGSRVVRFLNRIGKEFEGLWVLVGVAATLAGLILGMTH